MKNFQSLKPKIEALVSEILTKHHLKIYEINNLNEFGQDTLQVLVEDETNPKKLLDLELMLTINEEVSNQLDSLDNLISDNYFLEVASAGVERKIKTEAEMINSVGEYLFVQLVKPTKEKLVEFNCTLVNYDPTTKLFSLAYFVKGQKKQIEVLYNDLKSVRYAVKF